LGDLEELEELYRQEIGALRLLLNTLIQKISILSYDVQVMVRSMESEVETIRKRRAAIKQSLLKEKKG